MIETLRKILNNEHLYVILFVNNFNLTNNFLTILNSKKVKKIDHLKTKHNKNESITSTNNIR